MKEELNILLKVREQAHLKNKEYKALITQVTNRKVKSKDLLEGLLAF